MTGSRQSTSVTRHKRRGLNRYAESPGRGLGAWLIILGSIPLQKILAPARLAFAGAEMLVAFKRQQINRNVHCARPARLQIGQAGERPIPGPVCQLSTSRFAGTMAGNSNWRRIASATVTNGSYRPRSSRQRFRHARTFPQRNPGLAQNALAVRRGRREANGLTLAGRRRTWATSTRSTAAWRAMANVKRAW